MSNQYFDFKQFRIDQDKCSMKVGTDGVLLGAWFPMEGENNVLDVGCGTGLVAIMAAQRGAGSVTAVEIDPEASQQAFRNAANSPWTDRIAVKCADIADFSGGKYDRIVCNPPYFRDSLRCPDSGRNTARHNDFLSYETLVACAVRMLTDDGLLCVVLPYDSVETFAKCAVANGLEMYRRTDVVTVAGKTPKRSLVAFGRHCPTLDIGVLEMYGTDGEETPEYVALVKDFYLRYQMP